MAENDSVQSNTSTQGNGSSPKGPFFHYTNKRFDKFDVRKGDIGLHFGSKKAAEDRRKEALTRVSEDNTHDKIHKVDLNIKNPARINDLGDDFRRPIPVAQELHKSGALTGQQKSRAMTMSESIYDENGQLDKERSEAAKKASFEYMRESAKGNGYDGLVYKNDVEDEGRDSYVAFDDDQIDVSDEDDEIDRADKEIYNDSSSGQELTLKERALEKARQAGEKRKKAQSAQSKSPANKEVNPKHGKGPAGQSANWQALEKAKHQKQKQGELKAGKSDPSGLSAGGKSAAPKTTGGVKGAGGGKGAKGGLDPNAMQDVAQKAMSGDMKGAVKEGAQSAAGMGLDKAMWACIDGLAPSFGLTLILMNIIWFISWVTGSPISLGGKLVTAALDGVILLLILAVIVFAIVMYVTACAATGFDGSGWVATIAGGPVTWIIDAYRGDDLGSVFAESCKAVGIIQ
jgi:hypothetical protein